MAANPGRRRFGGVQLELPVGGRVIERGPARPAARRRVRRAVPHPDRPPRRHPGRAGAHGPRRPDRAHAPRDRLVADGRAARAPAHHRHRGAQHGLHPRPRGIADARPHRERHRLPRPARVRARRRPPVHPLAELGEDRHVHGAPVRGDPAQPPHGAARPRPRRLRRRGRVRARRERRGVRRRPRDPRRPHRLVRRLGPRSRSPGGAGARQRHARAADGLPRPAARRALPRRARRAGRACSRTSPGRRPRRSPGVSLAFLVTGTARGIAPLRAAAARLPAGVEAVAVQCAPEGEATARTIAGLTVFGIGYLEDLRAMLARSASLA